MKWPEATKDHLSFHIDVVCSEDSKIVYQPGQFQVI